MKRKATKLIALIIGMLMLLALFEHQAMSIAVAGTIDIASVEIINGGSIQAQYRDSVYQGRAAYGEDPARYYTTMRDASFTDSRRFNFEIVIPAAGLPDLTDPTEAASYIAGISWTFGEIPLTQWLSSSSFNSSTSFIQLGSQKISKILSGVNTGDYLLEASIVFQTPYATSSSANAATNIPYSTYSAINQSGFNRAVMLNGRTGNYPNAGKGIGTYTLTAASSMSGILGNRQIKLNLYDSFRRWEEIDSYAKDLRTQAGEGRKINGRYVEVTSLGKTLDGRDIWNVVVAKDAAIVDDYLNRIKPLMNTDPEALTAEANAGTLTQVVYLNNVHPDEVPGTDAIIQTVDELIWEDELQYGTYDDLDRRFTDFANVTNSRSYHLPTGSRRNQTLSVNDVLDNFIVVSTLTSNPDGKYNMIRGNRYAFDLERDASFQTQPESIALTMDIAKWEPLVMLEYHGYVTNMLIEPCTLPHNPNYEYDLLQSNMLQLAYYMGKAINGDTVLGVFHVPWDHQTGGWDDATAGFSTMFAMLFGTMGYSIEIPYANQDSVDACHASINSMFFNLLYGKTAVYNDHPAYINITLDAPSHVDMRQSTLLNKLEWKRRGMKNIDAKEIVDKYFMDYANNVFTNKGRIRKTDDIGNELSFFPDYLIIPIDPSAQWNVAEAYRSLEIARNFGVKLLQTTAEIEDNNGVKYPADTFVIPLAQANRNYINEVFGKGYDASGFASMYTETVTNYPDTRGFDAVEVWNKDYSASTKDVTNLLNKPASLILGGVEEFIAFKSNSVDAVRFVNKLLSGTSSGKYNLTSVPADVWMLRKNITLNEGTANEFELLMGAYLISAKDLGIIETLKDDADLGLKGCYIEGWYLKELPAEAVKLVNPIIHLTTTRTASSGNPVHWALDDYLGFSSMKGYDGTGIGDLRPGANVLFLNNNTGSAALTDAVRDSKIGVVATGGSNGTSFLTSQFGLSFSSSTGGSTSNSDGTFNVKYNPGSLFSAGYRNTGSVHLTSSTAYFTAMPSNAKPLFTTDANNPFIGGFYRNWDTQMRGSTVAYSLFTKETDGRNISAMVLPNIFSRPHYHKLYPMLATAIYASAAGILDDQNAPVINDITTEPLIDNKTFSVTVDAEDMESGIKNFAFYQWNNNADVYELKAQQNTNSYVFNGLEFSVDNRFKIVVSDYAGNEAVEILDINALITVTSVMVSPNPVSVHKGFTQAFTAIVEGANNPAQTVTWTVEGGVAGTSITTGGVLTVAAGETASSLTVRATSAIDNTKSGTATITVTVETIPVTGISVEPGTAAIVVGGALQITASVEPGNATNKNVSWVSNNPAVAAVSASGMVTAVSNGRATITATTTYGTFTATCAVLVIGGDKPIINPEPPVLPPDTPGNVEPAVTAAISNIQEAAQIITTIKAKDFILNPDGTVTIDKNLVMQAAKDALKAAGFSNKEVNEVVTFPVIKANISNPGGVAAVGIYIKGSLLMAEFASDIKLLKILASDSRDGDRGKLFEYESDPKEFGDKKFTLQSLDSRIYDGEIQPDEFYELIIFIKDGGGFDLDGKMNAAIVDPVALLSVGDRNRGGCSASFGLFTLALIGVMPFVLRKKR